MDWGHVTVTHSRSGCLLCRVWFDDPADALTHQCPQGNSGELMSDERLAEIEGGNSCEGPGCDSERAELIAEVRRLRRENHLLHLSRGTASEGGSDA